GVTVRVVDEHGRTLPAGREGLLCARSPLAAAGYLAAGGDLLPLEDAGGWIRTGDLARIDAGGYVFLTGRQDDVINVGGAKVHPGAVEEALSAYPGVAEAAAFALPD